MKRGLFALAVLLLSATTVTGQGGDTTVYSAGNGASWPSRVKSVKAPYTPEAMAARVQGWITLEAIVLSDGNVGDVKVIGSCLGSVGAHREPNGDPFRCNGPMFGLDQLAVKAVKQWVYRPGMKDRKPVAVHILLQLTFTLKDKSSN